MSKHIFWIASYPKSGNTLLRSIISSLFFSDDGNFRFNMLKNIPIIEDTTNLEFIKQKKTEDYNNLDKLDTISKYWLNMQTKENLGFVGDFMFVKTHHALIKLFDKPFTTQENTRGIIYVVRDPRDIVLSMCNHFNFDIEESIASLLNENFALKWHDSKNLYKYKKKPISFLSSWEKHYFSWVDDSFDCPKLVIKYEDLVYDKNNTIRNIAHFFEINYKLKINKLETKIPNIIKQTDFNNFKNKEKNSGFSESVNNNFFNVGKKNQWLKNLSKDAAYIIEKECFNLLNKLNYTVKFYNQK